MDAKEQHASLITMPPFWLQLRCQEQPPHCRSCRTANQSSWAWLSAWPLVCFPLAISPPFEYRVIGFWLGAVQIGRLLHSRGLLQGLCAIQREARARVAIALTEH
jgi:hypothetical protein